MANNTQKWKTAFFLSKNAVFLFWPKIQKLTPLYYTEKFWKFIIWSQIHNTLPDGALNGTFWALFGQKRPFSQRSPAQNHFSLLIFDGEDQPQVYLAFCHFGLFLVIFGHFWLIFPLFMICAQNVRTEAIFLYKKIRHFNICIQIAIPYPIEP